jgi:hypothetical protein
MWFEVPQKATNYGNYIDHFHYDGVGPDGSQPLSNPTQWCDNPPVLFISRPESYAAMPLSEDGVPPLESNSGYHFDNPPTIDLLFLPFDVSFGNSPVGEDFIEYLDSQASMQFDTPQIVPPYTPAYAGSNVFPLPPDAFFTESVQTAFYDLPREGRNFDYELTGFQASPTTPEPVPVMPTMLFPNEFFPKVPYDEIAPFEGVQRGPLAASVFPPVGSPGCWRPTIRPRRR